MRKETLSTLFLLMACLVSGGIDMSALYGGCLYSWLFYIAA